MSKKKITYTSEIFNSKQHSSRPVVNVVLTILTKKTNTAKQNKQTKAKQTRLKKERKKTAKQNSEKWTFQTGR